ncbi:MAG: hypothetical protein WBX01_08910 [Nitrososphaeraceae archaeon]
MVSLSEVYGTAADGSRNLIDYLYDYFPSMRTPTFLEAVDSEKTYGGGGNRIFDCLISDRPHPFSLRMEGLGCS